MRNKILGMIGIVWGIGIIISFFARGAPIGDGSYAAGALVGLLMGAAMFIAGIYYVRKKQYVLRIDSDASSVGHMADAARRSLVATRIVRQRTVLENRLGRWKLIPIIAKATVSDTEFLSRLVFRRRRHTVEFPRGPARSQGLAYQVPESDHFRREQCDFLS